MSTVSRDQNTDANPGLSIQYNLPQHEIDQIWTTYEETLAAQGLTAGERSDAKVANVVNQHLDKFSTAHPVILFKPDNFVRAATPPPADPRHVRFASQNEIFTIPSKDFFDTHQATNLDPKNLHTIFTSDPHKLARSHQIKFALLRTAAIALLISYIALAIGAIVLTGLFAPPLALPLTAIAALVMIYPVLKGYASIDRKAKTNQQIAQIEKGVNEEFKKLDKLSSQEFRTNYADLLPSNYDDVLKMLKIQEKAYKFAVARHLFWQGEFKKFGDRIPQRNQDFQKNIADINNKQKNETKQARYTKELTKQYEIENHQLNNGMAASKMQAAFTFALLKDPCFFGKKPFSKVVQLNPLPLGAYKQAAVLYMEDLPTKASSDPTTKKIHLTKQEVWGLHFEFAQIENIDSRLQLDEVLDPNRTIKNLASLMLTPDLDPK